jgi:hypothetical protein
MACAREIAALSEEAQKRFMVMAGTLSGNPAASAAHRATSPMPSWAVFTQPATMSWNPGALARGPPSTGPTSLQGADARASPRTFRTACVPLPPRMHL